MRLSEMTTVRILGKDYLIKDNYCLDTFGLTGRVELVKSTIEICPDLSRQEWAETLLHEIIHAIDLSTSAGDDSLTESQVTRISALLYATLVDNNLLEE
jgi:hypothetical protein